MAEARVPESRILEYLAIYRHMVAARIRAQLEYRTSFALSLFGAFAATFLDFVAIAVIFTHLPRLDGWSIYEVGFLYATSQLSFAATDLLVGHFDRMGEMVRMGEVDSILVRPLSTVFQVATADFQLRRVGKAIQALAVMAYAVPRLDLTWTPFDIVLLVVTLIGGTVIFTSVWLIGAAACFWSPETREINNAFTYGGTFLASYPLEVYGAWLRRILALAIPMAFVNYFPAQHLLERDDPFGWPEWLRFASPAVAVATAVCAGLFWRFAIRHYRSTGS